jgi:hypothetical protein
MLLGTLLWRRCGAVVGDGDVGTQYGALDTFMHSFAEDRKKKIF